MAVIDIGPGATNRSSSVNITDCTLIDANNVANETGILDTFELWPNAGMMYVKMGTFSGSGTSYNDRDYETIGTVTHGSKQTFTGKNCDVSSGDLLGIFWSTTGKLERDTSGGSGTYYVSGDKFNSGSATYNSMAGAISIYATGATAGGASVWLPFMKHHLIGGF